MKASNTGAFLHASSRIFQTAVAAVILSLSSHQLAYGVTIDLSNVGGNGGGYGNSLQFSSGDLIVQVMAFGETGAETPANSNYYLFENAEAYSWNTGIGVCNQNEGYVGSNCSSNEHEIDTVGRDDLVVFYFNQTVNFEFLTVDPYLSTGGDPNDRDIIYWVGNVPSVPDLTVETFNTLSSISGVSGETLSQASSSYAPFTHTLSGTGNLLLLSGNYHDLGCKGINVTNDIECEAYKLKDISVNVIPVPATAWLLGSALLGLAGFRRASTK